MKTHWDKAAHFIGIADCKFGLCDVVNGCIISTVGDYRPQGIPTEIGNDRTYETMVFYDSGRRCERIGCPCGGIPDPVAWSEIDMEGYNSQTAAMKGHAAMVSKYETLKRLAARKRSS